MDTTPLRQFITAAYPFKEEELESFMLGWQPLECKRKTILTAVGETERYLYFVLEGIQRGFYIGDDKQEATLVFTYAPSFSGLADSFLTPLFASIPHPEVSAAGKPPRDCRRTAPR